MNARLDFCIRAAHAGGRSTLALYGTKFEVKIKSDKTPVTMADERAEQVVREMLGQEFPNETILGEEQGLSGHGLNRWIIDPIDGTKAFISGVPLYATLLSYEIDAEPVVAACYIPGLDEMYYAAKGEGAFLNGRRIQVKDVSNLADAVILNGSIAGLKSTGRLDGYLNLVSKTKMAKGWSDAYGHMLVARGDAQAMIDPVLARWDLSAPSLIVREAGGCFTDFSGSDALGSEGISCVPSLRHQFLTALQAS